MRDTKEVRRGQGEEWGVKRERETKRGRVVKRERPRGEGETKRDQEGRSRAKGKVERERKLSRDERGREVKGKFMSSTWYHPTH